MHIQVFSLFPGMFEGVLHASIMKKAQEKDAVTFNVTDFRAYSENKHAQVDDYPYGGGAGMVLKPEPLFNAVESLETTGKPARVILMCPQGERFTQQKAEELAQEENLVFLCGHYEGMDARILDEVDQELCIGDYILTGGELAAMVISDAIIRLKEDVISSASHDEESFVNGLVEYPHYTTPMEYEGKVVPEVLASGHHENIRRYRLKESLRKTKENRPDLLEKKMLTAEEIKLLEELD